MESEIKDGLLSGYLRKARLVRAAKYVKGKQILDIGCDRGYILPYLPDNIKYHGVDADARVLEAARQNYPQHTFERLMISLGSIAAISDNQYDTIIMIAVIEHLGDSIEILKQLREKLTPEGRIVITTPHRRSHLLLVMMAYLRLARNDKHEHEHYIDQQMIQQLVRSKDFNLLESSRFQCGLNQLWVLEKRDNKI